MIKLLNGDCREMLKALPSNSIDSCCTDPPYGLSFMGKTWDYDVPGVEMWREVFRVLKPGAHLLSFFGSRTYHRGVIPIEDAGFEIRDQIMWLYGSGFPKSPDISKGIDKAAGVEREVIGHQKLTGTARTLSGNKATHGDWRTGSRDIDTTPITAPATDAAKQWEGWGTALKPAHEPIVVARKPFSSTVAENMLAHGTGGLNIDGCRVGTEKGGWGGNGRGDSPVDILSGSHESGEPRPTVGRWPANVIHDGSDEVLDGFPDRKTTWVAPSHANNRSGDFLGAMKHPGKQGFNDEGSAARFFYCAKTSKRDRDEGLDLEPTVTTDGRAVPIDNAYLRGETLRKNNHPTVKPTDLMRYLCRLVTPPGGTVLDPFMGSGSTGKAAILENFNFIGVELSPDYLAIAKARIYHSLGSDLV